MELLYIISNLITDKRFTVRNAIEEVTHSE
jgi:hypothetical protein